MATPKGMCSGFLQILNEWVTNGCLTQIRDLFENTSSLRDLAKRSNLVNSYRLTNGVRSTLLLTACDKGYCDIVTFLVKNCNADVNLSGDILIGDTVIEGVSPLWLCCNKNKVDLATILLEAGADLNVSTKKTRSTPLRAACYGGYVQLVKILVTKGANIELANWRGSTCLMVACARGYYEIVELFLSFKVDVNRVAADGHTALHDAAESGDLRILKLLLNHGAVAKPNNLRVTPVLSAAINEHDDAVTLLSKGLSKDKQAEALELLGAKKICSGKDKHKKNSADSQSHHRSSKSMPSNVKEGLDCWFKAASLRSSVLSRYNKHLSDIKPRAVYNNLVEFKNTKELHVVQRSMTDVHFTALLICERIIGLEHPFTYNSIREVAVYFGKLREFKTCFRLCLHAVDIHLLNLDPFCEDTFHIFRCCVNLFFAFKLDDQPSLVDECSDILVDLFDRIMTQLERITERAKTSPQLLEDKRRVVNGYFSLAIHVLSILSEDAGADFVSDFVSQLSSVPIPNGNKVFLALSIMSPKCEGCDVVDWNAVGSVSKRHVSDIASKAFRLASVNKLSQQASNLAPVLSDCNNSNNVSRVDDSFNNKSTVLLSPIKDDQYQPVQVLSQGDFCKAVVALRPVDKTRVVLKEMRLSGLEAAEKHKVLLETKALITHKYHHPHLVQLFKLFEKGENVVLEMEFCPGGDLSALISKHKADRSNFPERIVRTWISQLASGVKFLHDHDIVHGNISTKKVLIDSDWKIKLGAFCHVKKVCRRSSLTLGAPEVVQKMQPFSKKSDVWSLGALTFELATFNEPFEVIEEKSPKLKRVPFPAGSPYSEGFRRFVDKLLCNRPDDRPSIEQVFGDQILRTS